MLLLCGAIGLIQWDSVQCYSVSRRERWRSPAANLISLQMAATRSAALACFSSVRAPASGNVLSMRERRAVTQLAQMQMDPVLRLIHLQ